MKITKAKLKQIIKEELGKVTEGNFEQAYNDLLGEEEEEEEAPTPDPALRPQSPLHRAFSA